MKGIQSVETWSGILVYLEYEKKLSSVSRELIGEAVRLARKSNQQVYGIAVGRNLEGLKRDLRGYPIKTVFLYQVDCAFQADIWEGIISRCIAALRPSALLIGGTYQGRSIAPRIAVAFQTGLTAECTSLEIDSHGALTQIRPAFGGNLMARIITPETRPQIATVRPGVMEVMEGAEESTITFRESTEANPDRGIIIEQMVMSSVRQDITKEELLVVAGRGVREREDLKMLEELAHLLGGGLACSRALVEKGWFHHSRQIGLSGNTVRPKCMLTCGVSGTVQFMAGMQGTKNIIAINQDAEAPIFRIAHYPICQDIYEVIPRLIEMLKEQVQQ